MIRRGGGGGGEDVGDGGERDGACSCAVGGDPEKAVGGDDEETGFEERETSRVVFALNVDGGEEGAFHLTLLEHRAAAPREFGRR